MEKIRGKKQKKTERKRRKAKKTKKNILFTVFRSQSSYIFESLFWGVTWSSTSKGRKSRRPYLFKIYKRKHWKTKRFRKEKKNQKVNVEEKRTNDNEKGRSKRWRTEKKRKNRKAISSFSLMLLSHF